VTGIDATHSVVLASIYQVPDPGLMWEQITARRSQLASIGAHHAVVYVSTDQPGLVLVTIGVRRREPVAKLVRSPVIREWFDVVGVEDFPLVFAGEIVEKVDVEVSPDVPPGVVVAAFANVTSVDEVGSRVHRSIEHFGDAGIRKLWMYQALDEPGEMLFLHEFDDEKRARRWIDVPDPAAEWMSRPERNLYPPLFVGRLVDVLPIESRG
jgi:hypothetical protein